jgi:leucyl aminopeptidase
MRDRSFFGIELCTQLPPSAENTAICVFEDEPYHAGTLDNELREAVNNLVSSGEFKGEEGASLIVHTIGRAGGAPPRRLLLIGLGKHADFDLSEMNRAASVAVRRADASRIRQLYFVIPSSQDARHMARTITEGAVLGLYDNSLYQESEDETGLEMLSLVMNERDEELLREIEQGQIIAEAVNWARSLADEPGGKLPPRELARRASEMTAELGEGSGLRVEIIEADEIRARGMGGLSAVGQGSDEEPVLIVAHYEPEGVSDDEELWAFVGKGITFDTGGISLKKAEHMEEMKSDMAGGAAALGALRAIAQLKLRRRIVAIVPSAENMPSGRAIKPGDVIRTLAGYTIEVVDTDAEGRLVLADGIAYARQLGAKRIVDLATLTGSIIVALGDHRAGLFSNDDEWALRVERAAESACEPAWRMPVSDDYKKRIESPIADFKNYGGRPDATAAALLLSKFAGDTPWVHLDIAGTAWNDHAQPHAPKGATGAGVRSLVELAASED